MPGLRRRDLLRAGLLGATGLAVAACSSTTPAETSSSAAPPPRRWGAFIPSVMPVAGTTRTPLQQLTNLAGAPPSYVHCFAAIGDEVPLRTLSAITEFGATPLLTLEPWRPDGGITQPAYALSQVAAGRYDTEFARWGRTLASWGKPVLLRFAQEMNGTWYPWAVGVNGNTAADYRAAWTRMHTVISAQRPGTLEFVWAPNTLTLGTSPFDDAYPGPNLVDRLGLDGYNWGDVPGHHWQSAPDLFTSGLAALARLDSRHPILITEVAAAEGEGPDAKANWIRDFFGVVENHSRVQGFVWFQMDKERDWRFNSTPASLAAFRQGLATMVGG
ncbi:glycoside hydrolase family 26 protein [Gordonia sp. NPDC003504]